MRKTISVAMATYNGAKYVQEQIESILVQLGTEDELVISDDGSTDNTVSIIKTIADKRIQILQGPGKGVKANFNNALRNCKGDYIFLADQDDVWHADKVSLCLAALAEHDLVVHDACVVNSDNTSVLNPSFYSVKNSGAGWVKNIIRNTYIGCCMCFTRKLLAKVLPIPNDIEMHDQWIGVINDLEHKNTIFIKEKLLYYRRHGATVTSVDKRYPFTRMLSNRYRLVRALLREGKL